MEVWLMYLKISNEAGAAEVERMRMGEEWGRRPEIK